MMRLRVNLGRRPVENLRRVRLVWGSALLILVLAFAGLAVSAWFGWRGTRAIQAQTAALRAQIAPLQLATAQTSAPLRGAGTQAIVARAQFLNQLIARKSVSWTQLFEQLEQIQPPGVELISLQPLQRNGQNAVDLRFASETLQPAIDFVQSLETSGDFADAVVTRETEAPERTNAGGPRNATAPPRFQLELNALYTPQDDTGPGPRAASPRDPGGRKP